MNAHAAAARLRSDGFVHLPATPESRAWAAAALASATPLIAAPEQRAAWLRCEGTWFAGVDLLPNDAAGQVGRTPLAGPAPDLLAMLDMLPQAWHRAQVSVTYPGYPRPKEGESPAAGRYRMTRDAAHVDGLLPIGPARRRMLRDPHAFILGLPLSDAAPDAAPLVVWPGSHRLLGAAFRTTLKRGPQGPGEGADPTQIDLTDAYVSARREAFGTCRRTPLPAVPGDALLLHRHLLHGIAPWTAPPDPSGRAIAYFRPQLCDASAWF